MFVVGTVSYSQKFPQKSAFKQNIKLDAILKQ